MTSRVFCVIALALGGTVFLTGAWPGPLARPSENAASTFVAQTISLDPSIVGDSVNAGELVSKSLATLCPSKVRWLKTQIRQTMQTPQSSFVAEGTLHRGPQYCARLEMTIGAGTILVVSDGRVAARVREIPGCQPKTDVDPLPGIDAGKRDSLAGLGCDGPVAMLRKIQPHLVNATLATGMLSDEPVIRVKVTLPDKAQTPDLLAIGAPRYCQVYLHANTLWPIRIEWLTVEMNQSTQTSLRVEFLEPSINRELDHATCERLFSYQPAESTVATNP
ncbi:MAG: hypothetical protein EXS16_05770 [Gemmataceae bacterium]|nr:hypothetical protein [Gemmataceae bacterium]